MDPLLIQTISSGNSKREREREREGERERERKREREREREREGEGEMTVTCIHVHYLSSLTLIDSPITLSFGKIPFNRYPDFDTNL